MTRLENGLKLVIVEPQVRVSNIQCSAQYKSSALKEIRNNPILRPFSSLVIFFPSSFWNHRVQNSLKITSSLFTGGQVISFNLQKILFFSMYVGFFLATLVCKDVSQKV